MPHLFVLAAVGAGAYAGYRVLRAVAGALAEPSPGPDPAVDPRTRDRASDARDLGALEFDAASGVYRPRD